MQTFKQWCIANGWKVTSPKEAKEALAAYLNSLQTTCAWLRKSNKNLDTVVSAKIDEVWNPANAMQTLNTINVLCSQIKVSGAVCLKSELDNATRLRTPMGTFMSIATPRDFRACVWGQDMSDRVEIGLVMAYVELLINAIRSYAKQGVPHSNEIQRLSELVEGQLKAFRDTRVKETLNKTMLTCQIFDANVPHSVGATSLNMICEFWSKQRRDTRKRRNECINWAAGGQNHAVINLRRVGSAGEAQSIAQERCFKQAPRLTAHKDAGSFERYKWFLDLSVDGATTSVDDTKKKFDIYLCTGTVPLLEELKRVYKKDDQPAVTYKPDMGGEKGCFGIHEDVLPLFHALISRIVIIDVQSGKTDSDLKFP